MYSRPLSLGRASGDNPGKVALDSPRLHRLLLYHSRRKNNFNKSLGVQGMQPVREDSVDIFLFTLQTYSLLSGRLLVYCMDVSGVKHHIEGHLHWPTGTCSKPVSASTCHFGDGQGVCGKSSKKGSVEAETSLEHIPVCLVHQLSVMAPI